jgi:hypothetical protein
VMVRCGTVIAARRTSRSRRRVSPAHLGPPGAAGVTCAIGGSCRAGRGVLRRRRGGRS